MREILKETHRFKPEVRYSAKSIKESFKDYGNEYEKIFAALFDNKMTVEGVEKLKDKNLFAIKGYMERINDKYQEELKRSGNSGGYASFDINKVNDKLCRDEILELERLAVRVNRVLLKEEIDKVAFLEIAIEAAKIYDSKSDIELFQRKLNNLKL